MTIQTIGSWLDHHAGIPGSARVIDRDRAGNLVYMTSAQMAQLRHDPVMQEVSAEAMSTYLVPGAELFPWDQRHAMADHLSREYKTRGGTVEAHPLHILHTFMTHFMKVMESFA